MKKITSTLFLSLMISSSFGASIPKVIYGNDDRKEVFSYPDRNIQNLAKSVAGMVAEYRIFESGHEGYSTFDQTTLSQRINSCPGERFDNQPAFMSCTGFLVGEDLLITAGHCIKTVDDCSRNKWVFGFTADKKLIPNRSVYNCSEIVKRSVVNIPVIGTTDYAVIRLDRKVKDRAPLKFRTSGRIKNGTDVLIIGHPMGLPMKIADNATAKGSFGKTFRANLDSYGGNSGSPVMDAKTGLVEGILVHGAKDYREVNGCSQSRHSNGHSEVIYKVTRLKALQELYEDGKL